jgi:hypothetical protein
MRTVHFWLSLAVAGALLTPLSAQRLYWLGTTGGNSYATGVSNDGLTVVGEANGNAVVWDRAANTIITVYNGSSAMSGCDATGAIAVGLVNPATMLIKPPLCGLGCQAFSGCPRTPTSAGAPTSPRRAHTPWVKLGRRLATIFLRCGI